MELQNNSQSGSLTVHAINKGSTVKTEQRYYEHINKISTDLAFLSSLHPPPGFINIHREIHPKGNITQFHKQVHTRKRQRQICPNALFQTATYPCTSDRSAWCLDRGGGGCALGIRSILFTPDYSKSKYFFPPQNAITDA